MGDNNEISNLLERISAQTEVHEKYTQAFVKIIESLEEIKDKIVSANTSDSEYFRYLLEKLVGLSGDIRGLMKSNSEADSELREYIKEYNRSANEIIEGIADQNAGIESLGSTLLEIVDRLDASQAFLQKCLDNIGLLTVEIDKLFAANKEINATIADKLDSMAHVADITEGQVQILYDAHGEGKKLWKKVATYIIALLLFVGMAEALIQFGVLKVTWFGK